MATKKKPVVLTDCEIEALAYFFNFFWCVIALAPGNNRSIRGLLASLGLIEKRGKLSPTKQGKRVLAFCREEGRPKYPAV